MFDDIPVGEMERIADTSKQQKDYLEVLREERKKKTNLAWTAEQVYEQILATRALPDRLIYTGVEWWDRFAGPLRRGNTYVLAGYPGAGKTTLALNLAWSLATHGKKVWYFCLELMASEVFEVVAGHIQKTAVLTDKDITMAYAKIQGTGLRFYEPKDYHPWDIHLENICNTVRNEKIDVVFIDNLGFLTRSIKNTFEVENVASAKIKALSQELAIPIFLLHHLRKPESDQLEPEPNVHSMKGSGAILADASDAFILHHPMDDAETQTRNEVGYLLSGKPRWGKGGKKYIRLEGGQRTYYLDSTTNYKRSKGKKVEFGRGK